MRYSTARRGGNGGPYPGGIHGYTNYGGVTAGNMAKTDYASNSGDGGDQDGGGGPGSLAAGDATNWASYASSDTGVIYVGSQTRFAEIINGTSNTIMIGEKYLNPSDYFTGNDARRQRMHVRRLGQRHFTFLRLPRRCGTWPGSWTTTTTAARTPAGANFVFCDGSVSLVEYSISPTVFDAMGRRAN